MEQRDPASQASPGREAPFTLLRCPTARSSLEGLGVKVREQRVVTGEAAGWGKQKLKVQSWRTARMSTDGEMKVTFGWGEGNYLNKGMHICLL